MNVEFLAPSKFWNPNSFSLDREGFSEKIFFAVLLEILFEKTVSLKTCCSLAGETCVCPLATLDPLSAREGESEVPANWQGLAGGGCPAQARCRAETIGRRSGPRAAPVISGGP